VSRQAKTISDEQLQGLLRRIVGESKDPLRDYAVVLLSFKAGLRVGEIAGLQWRDVLTSDGKLADIVAVPSSIAKKGNARDIPMHPALKVTLEQLFRQTFPAGGTHADYRGRLIRGLEKRRPYVSADALRKYLARLYREHGLDCTSHSGRRTFITKAIRAAPLFDCSLRDVQNAAGHRNIDTTETYIDLSPNMAKLIGAI
jgi:integrase